MLRVLEATAGDTWDGCGNTGALRPLTAVHTQTPNTQRQVCRSTDSRHPGAHRSRQNIARWSNESWAGYKGTRVLPPFEQRRSISTAVSRWLRLTLTRASPASAPSEWACLDPAGAHVSLYSPLQESPHPPPATSFSCWAFCNQLPRSPLWLSAGQEPARRAPLLQAGAFCKVASCRRRGFLA